MARCLVIGENGLRCPNPAYLDRPKCFAHDRRERTDKEHLPPLGPPPRITERFEARAAAKRATTTSTTPHVASFAVSAPNSISGVAGRMRENACLHGFANWDACPACSAAADFDYGAFS